MIKKSNPSLLGRLGGAAAGSVFGDVEVK